MSSIDALVKVTEKMAGRSVTDREFNELRDLCMGMMQQAWEAGRPDPIWKEAGSIPPTLSLYYVFLKSGIGESER